MPEADKVNYMHSTIFYGFGFNALHIAPVEEGPEMPFLPLQKTREGKVSCLGRQKLNLVIMGNPVGRV